MKILVLNPNVSTDITKILEDSSSLYNYDNVQLDFANVNMGVDYIENDVEALIASYAVFDFISNKHDYYDAIIVAAFGDPGVSIIRKITHIPVVGLTESSFIAARLIGRYVGVFTISENFINWYNEVIDSLGFKKNVLFVQSLDVDVFSKGGDQKLIISEIRKKIYCKYDQLPLSLRPDAVMLAGAPLSGIAFHLKDFYVPVIDALDNAIRVCIFMSENFVNKNKNIKFDKKTLGLSNNMIKLLSAQNTT